MDDEEHLNTYFNLTLEDVWSDVITIASKNDGTHEPYRCLTLNMPNLYGMKSENGDYVSIVAFNRPLVI